MNNNLTKINVLILFLLFTFGCKTLDISSIKNNPKIKVEESILKPDYDIYNLRIDIIRQTESVEINDSTTEDNAVAYHPIGFYLGNGLFFDLNNNLSLLIPKLFNLQKEDDFTITNEYQSLFFNKNSINYSRTNNSFTAKMPFYTKKISITKQKNSITVKSGIFSQYKITKDKNELKYSTILTNRTIFKDSCGFYIKNLFGRIDFIPDGNTIYLGKRYSIVNKGDIIEIYGHSLFTTDYLIYKIIKNKEGIFIYNNKYRGKKISILENKITVQINDKVVNTYILTKAPLN